ncbi:MAG: hypothetical protein KDK70_31180, partial [Myxococcales bacterium]|nr:hypothetical protein [Myxococcales bacterium]
GAVDGAGNFWVTGLWGNLVRIDANSLAVQRWDFPGTTDPYGMTVDANGHPWTAGWNGDVTHFDPTTETFEVFPIGNFTLRGLQIDRNGMLWAAVNNPCGVAQFDTVTKTIVNANIALPGCGTPVGVSIDVDGNVKLVDFGMAAVWQEGREPWQDLDAMRYLSADHVRHGPSASSDIYSVGAIIHELLSGEQFRGECETEAEMRAAIDRAEPPPCPRPDVPTSLERLRRGLLEPIPQPRLTLEHMLELCESIPDAGGREQLSSLVRTALRIDSTQPDADGTPPRGIAIEADVDGIAHARGRSSAAVHTAAVGAAVSAAAGPAAKLEAVPLGQSPRAPKPRDTQSVPVPVQHEVTAAREPMFLSQTAPPKGHRARDAEIRRSGLLVDHDASTDPIEEVRARLEQELDRPRSRAAQRVSDLLEDPGVTAEVTKVPQLPEDRAREQAAAAAATTTAAPPRAAWLRGPLGWALLGAVAVGIGLPLVARCGSATPDASSRSSSP